MSNSKQRSGLAVAVRRLVRIGFCLGKDVKKWRNPLLILGFVVDVNGWREISLKAVKTLLVCSLVLSPCVVQGFPIGGGQETSVSNVGAQKLGVLLPVNVEYRNSVGRADLDKGIVIGGNNQMSKSFLGGLATMMPVESNSQSTARQGSNYSTYNRSGYVAHEGGNSIGWHILAMVVGYCIGAIIGFGLLTAFLQREDIVRAWRYKRWKRKMGRAPVGEEWGEVFSSANVKVDSLPPES